MHQCFLGGVTAGQVGTVLDQQHCLAAISTHEDDSRDSASGRVRCHSEVHHTHTAHTLHGFRIRHQATFGMAD